MPVEMITQILKILIVTLRQIHDPIEDNPRARAIISEVEKFSNCPGHQKSDTPQMLLRLHCSTAMNFTTHV